MSRRVIATLCALAGPSLATAAPAKPAIVAPSRAEILDTLAGLASEVAAERTSAAARAGLTHDPLFVHPLRAMLADGPSEVRVAAARALGDIGIPGTKRDLSALTGSLLAAAKDPDVGVAEAAARAAARYPFPEIYARLQAIADSAPAIVRAAIEEGSPSPEEAQVRMTAWLALAQKKDLPAARDADLVDLARDLLDPQGRPDRVGVARSLAAWPAIDEALPFLERAMAEKDAAARRAAIEGIAKIRSPRADAAIMAAKEDADGGVRLRAAKAIQSREKDVRALLAWLDGEGDSKVAAALITALKQAPHGELILEFEARTSRWTDRQINDALILTDPDDPASSSRLPGLGLLARWLVDAEKPALAAKIGERIRPRADDEVVPALARVLPELEGTMRLRVLDAWKGRKDPRIADALIGELSVARASPADLFALEQQPEARVRPRVVALLDHPQSAVRAEALVLAKKWQGDDVTAGLGAALARSPKDDAAFEALLAQTDAHGKRTTILLALLAEAAHETRRPAIMKALVKVQDPRVAEAASDAADARPELARLAIDILERQLEIDAVRGLARIAKDTRVYAPDRVRALDLVSQRADHETAVTHLMANARDESLEVKMAARRKLHSLDPDVFPDWDPYGRIPLVAIGGGFGASMLLLAGDIADAKLSPAFTAGAGLVLGAATPYLLTLGEDVTLGDAAYFGTMSGWGTIAGWGVGSALGLDLQDTRWLTLGGEALGITIGALTMGSAEWGLADALLANTTALEVALTASMIRGLSRDATGQGEAAMIAGAIASVPMAFLARRLEVRGDLDVIFTMMGHGAWLGAFAPTMFGKDDAALQGAIIGQGLGYLGGLALAHALDVDGGDLALSFVGSAFGAMTFGGLALSIDGASPAARAGLVEAGSIAGVVALGLLADQLELRGNDALIVTLGGLLGAAAGSRLDVRIATDDFAAESLAGNTLLGMGLGIGGALALSQLVDATDAEVGRTLAGGAVLAVGGFGLGRAIDGASPGTRSLLTGGALAAGMLLTAPFAESLSLGVPEIGFGSIAGASIAAWSSQIYSQDEQQAGTAALGASLGFAGGVALAQFIPVESGDLPLVAAGSLLGSTAGMSLRLLAPEMSPTGQSIALQGLGALGLIGATALASTRGGLLHGGEALKSSLFLGAHGAVFGGLIAPLRRPGDAAIDAEIGGGMLLGTSIGMTAGVVAAELFGLELAEGTMVESTVFTAAAHGLGLGIGLATGTRQAGSAAMGALGVVGLVGGMALAPLTTYDEGDIALTSSLMLLGAWHGGWLSALDRDVSDQARGGAMLAGSSLGLATGLALSPIVTIDPFDVAEATLIAQAASALGGGIAWSIPNTTFASHVLSMELAGVAGLLAGGFIAANTTLTREDHGLIALGSAIGAAQAARAQPMWNAGVDRAPAVFLGAGAGFLGGLALGQLTDLAAFDQLEIGLFTAAGNVIGGGVELAGLSAREGAAVGTALGLGALTAGVLLAPITSYSSDDGKLVGMGVGIGAYNGLLLGDAIGDHDGAGAMIGAGAGMLGAMALAQGVEIDGLDLVEAALLASAGHAIGAGLGWTLDGITDRGVSAMSSGFGLAALTGAMIAAPHTRYRASDYGLMGLGLGLGTWSGAWMGYALGEERAGGSVLLGAGAGVLLGSMLGGLTDVSAGAQFEAMAMWSYGSAIGGGLALTTSQDDRGRAAAFVEAGGMAGLAGAAAFSDQTSFDQADGFLVGALAVAGAWHGSTLPFLTGDAITPEARGGGALLGAGLFALGGHFLTQVAGYDGYDVGEIVGAGIVGNAMGFGLGKLINHTDDRAQMALIDGLGLASMGAMMALAPSIHIDEATWYDAVLFGSMGAALGGVLPLTWSDPNASAPTDMIGGGAVLGASLGLGASVLLGQALELDAGNRQSIAFGAAAGALTGAGLGLAISTDDRYSTGLFEGLTLAGATLVGLTRDRVDLTAGDVGLGALWTGYLTWHQLGITLLTGGTDRQAAGLTMTTMGVGALSAMYLAPKLQLKGTDVLMLFAGSVWGSWIGGWTGRIVDREQNLQGQDTTGTLLLSTVVGSDIGLGLTSLVLTGLFDVEPVRFAVINLCGLGGMMIGMLTAGFAKEEPLEAGNVIGSLSGLALGALVTGFIDFGGSQSPYETAAAELDQPARGAPFSVSEWFPTAKVEPTSDGTGERYMIGVVGLWD